MAVLADTYGPFDAGPGSSFAEESWRKMMRHMLGSQSGVIRGFDNECEVFADSTGLQVKSRTGQVFMRGHWAEFVAEKTIPLPTAPHATLARKDRVILRADFINNRIEVDIITGTAAASPTVPQLTQSTSVWETSLAVIDVPAADTSIDAGQITDDRMYTSAQGRWTYQGAAQSIPNNAYTKIDYDTAVSRSGDIEADLTNNQFKLLRSGLWALTATFRFTSNATGKREILIADPATVSGITCTDPLAAQTDSGSFEIHLNAITINRFPVNQVVAAFLYQNSGGALAGSAGAKTSVFSAVWIGP